MSNDNSASVGTASIQRTVPTDGSIVVGFTGQGTLSDVVDVKAVDFKRQVKKHIADRTKLLGQANAKLAAAVRVRDAAVEALEVPVELLDQLEPVAEAMRAFDAGAAVVRLSGRAPLRIASADLARGNMTAKVVIEDPVRGTLYKVSRDFPLPPEVVAMHDTVRADEAQVAAYRGDIQKLNAALAGADDRVAEMKAAILEKRLEQTDDGKAALAAMTGVVDASIAGILADLSE